MSAVLERYQRIHLAPPSYTACKLCQFGGSAEPTRRCSNPQAGRTWSGTVQAMRATGGACGPEAVLMDFPGLNARR
jgi:hypothetical protein